LRVPARFNLYAALFAAVLAAAGGWHLFWRNKKFSRRNAGFSGGFLVLKMDFLIVPFPPTEISPPPRCFSCPVSGTKPPTVIDVPQFASGTACELNALYAYWQSQHHCRTTGGYSAMSNTAYDCLFYHPSPFTWEFLKDDTFLMPDSPIKVDIVRNTRFKD